MVSYYTTIQSILNYTRMFFDILIMWLLLYYTIKGYTTYICLPRAI